MLERLDGPEPLIDADAPVLAAGEIEIGAPLGTVWDILVDVEHWPEWNPEVRKAEAGGLLSAGATFRWSAGPGTITSKVRRLEPFRRLAWSGRTLGIRAVHVWELEPRADGTLVRTEESWSGWPARLLRGAMRKRLRDAIDAGLGYLKAEAERRSGA